IDDAHFVAILEVLSDATEIDADRNAETVERRLGADAGEHQQLRRVEGAARENHFTRRVRLPQLARGAAGHAVWPIEALPLLVLDADGAVLLVEQDARGQRVELDAQPIRM